MSRARRRRQREDASSPLSWVNNIWVEATRPVLLGSVLCIAGALIMSAPWIDVPARKVPGWWVMPVQATDVLQVAVMLGAAALTLGAGLCMHHIKSSDRTEHKRLLVSVLLMGLGALGCVMCWLSLWSDTPATQATFGIGQKVEYVVGRVRGEPVRIMLPRRVKVDRLVATSPASLTLTLSRPKQTDAEPQTLAVGESIEVEGKRLTFIGSGLDPQQLQGVIAGSSEQSIAAAARKGAKVRVTLDGPEYEVKDISLNYMGMGPAVQLEEGEKGAFWVFARQHEHSAKAFEHGLELLRVESMPAAVMTVGPVRPFEPLVVCAGIFILGLGGVLLWGGGISGGRDETTPNDEEE